MTNLYARPVFVLNTGMCIGCKTCVIACKDKHNLGPGVRLRRVYEFVGGEWISEADCTFRQNIVTYYISMSCNHCSNPDCVSVCPSGAMRQDEHGIVSVDESLCTGCRNCQDVCPYGAPQYVNEKGIVAKCDFCRSELESGDVPACVAACPTRALSFAKLADSEHVRMRSGALEILPISKLREASVFFKQSGCKRIIGSAGEELSNSEEIEDL